MHVDRNTATVIAHRNGAIDMDRDIDPTAITGQVFVDRIIEDLENAVVQSALIGIADVHSRPLPDRFQTLKFIDLGGVVFLRWTDAGGGFGWWAGRGGFFVGLEHRKAG